MADCSVEADKDALNLATGSKKLISDSTSLVDLKAEVARKKQEAQDNKAHGRHKANVTSGEKKNNFWSKANIGIIKRANADRERVRKEQMTSMKVQAALEQKAEIYEKLKDGQYVDKDSLLLVDFDKKDYQAKNEGEEWVEYIDPLGRTRTCMRSELEDMKHQDREEFGESGQIEPANSLKGLEDMRQKWEQEMEDNMKKNNLHFDDVTYDEARVYGAGRYKFSRNEAERTVQMDNLREASKETEEVRAKIESKKAYKDAKMEERLRKVRNRKRLKMGLPALPQDDIPIPNVDQEDPKPSIVKSVADNLRSLRQAEEDKERKKIIREWDVGKEGINAEKPTDQDEFREKLKINMERKVLSQDEWVDKKRTERPNEFAPPVNYSKSAKTSRPENSNYSAVPPPNQHNGNHRRGINAAHARPQGQHENRRQGHQNYSAVPPPCHHSEKDTKFSQERPRRPKRPQNMSEGCKTSRIPNYPETDNCDTSNLEQAIHFEGYNPYACSSRHKNVNKMSLQARMSLHEEFNERNEIERPSGVEIPPPMDMSYFNSEKKLGTKKQAPRTSNQMAEAFLQGLQSVKRPLQDDSVDSESE